MAERFGLQSMRQQNIMRRYLAEVMGRFSAVKDVFRYPKM